jgi:hypothetical protein
VTPRAWLGLLLVAAAGTALLALFRPSAPGDEPAGSGGSARCRECHREAYQEWEESWHARSWTDPDVRAGSNDFANAECIPCHAPRPVFETGLDQPVLPRASRREDGVDCLACHALGGADAGRVAGTIERPDAACAPRQVAELSGTAFCAPCHNQHRTVTEWLVSRYAAQGIGCIECHMPFRGGDPGRGRDHRMHGGHSLELLQAAVELRARREGGRVLVEVENVGAGHSFPTDERSRAADVFWRPLRTAAGPWRFLYRFRSPYRDEPDVTETVLPAHATLPIPLEDPEAAGPIEVALFYKLTPYWSDPERPDPEQEARLVERVQLGP